MGGTTTISTKENRINAFPVQKSAYGIAITMGWGTGRVAVNLIWYGDFKAIPKTTTTSSGGKGGDVEQKSTTYTYRASVMMGICRGPISGVTAVYRDKDVYTDGATTALAQAGLNLALGAHEQAPWSYLTTNHPSDAVGNSQLAYLYAADYLLGGGAQLQNHSVEVEFLVRESGSPDACPADIVDDVLLDPLHGTPGFEADMVDDLDDYGTYCRAAGLLLSPVLDAQVPRHEFITELMRATNTDVYESEGKLKFRPMALEEVSNGVETWTPDLTPMYDLDESDFIADGDEAPIKSDLNRSSDAYNIVQVEFQNRARQYDIQTMPAFDSDSIHEHGERKADPEKIHSIKSEEVAAIVAQQILERKCYMREIFRFRLGWEYSRLDPTDLVTVSSSRMNLDRKLVRILEIEDDADGVLHIEAEEVLAKADAALYPKQAAGGWIPSQNVQPGDVAEPVLFNPPTTLTEGRREVWAAVAGQTEYWGGCEVWASFDGTSYQRVGEIVAPARYGEITAVFASGADPDSTNHMLVDLSISRGELLPASQTDADHDVTLCLVGSELVSYRDAVMTDDYEYDLDYLRRGRFGTTPAAHGIGSKFVRLDENVFKLRYLSSQSGAEISLKFLSFNIYGKETQRLADVDPYTVTPTEVAAVADPNFTITLAHTTVSGTNGATWPAIRADWVEITDPECTGVLMEYRVVGESDTYFESTSINPHSSATQFISTTQSILGGQQYEARATKLYSPARTPSYSAWVQATGTTIETQVTTPPDPPTTPTGGVIPDTSDPFVPFNTDTIVV